MSEPVIKRLGLASKDCVYVLDTLPHNGDEDAIPSESRCDNVAYQVNGTRGLNSINDTANDADPYSFYTAYMQSLETTPIVLIQALTVIIYGVGLLANIRLLAYIVKFRRYTSPTFALIFGLGCCDVATCVCSIIFALIVMPTLIGPGWLCEFLIWTTTVVYTTSVCHMILFSVLRFGQLLFPLISRAKITVSLVTKMCICFWLLNMPAGITVPTFYTSGSFIYEGKPYTICELKAGKQKTNIIFDTICIIIPNIIIAGFHLVKHIIVLHRSKKKVSEQEHEHGRQTTDGRDVTLVITVFCVTSLPHVLHNYVHFVFDYPIQSFHQVLYQIDINLMYGNSALNPWIYVLAAKSVRHDIMAMLKLK